MSVYKYAGRLFSTLLVVGGCTGQDLISPDPAGESFDAGKQSVLGLPFGAHLEGVGAVPDDPTRCAPLITAGNSTVGTMTHLGRVTAEHSQCIDPTGALQDPLAFSGGRVTVTAANGDQLFLAFSGTLIPTEITGFFEADNPFQIVGGTGRFQGASGGGQATGSLDVRVPETPLVLNLDGRLLLSK